MNPAKWFYCSLDDVYCLGQSLAPAITLDYPLFYHNTANSVKKNWLLLIKRIEKKLLLSTDCKCLSGSCYKTGAETHCA